MRKYNTVMTVKKGNPRKKFDFYLMYSNFLDLFFCFQNQNNIFEKANKYKKQNDREYKK